MCEAVFANDILSALLPRLSQTTSQAIVSKLVQSEEPPAEPPAARRDGLYYAVGTGAPTAGRKEPVRPLTDQEVRLAVHSVRRDLHPVDQQILWQSRSQVLWSNVILLLCTLTLLGGVVLFFLGLLKSGAVTSMVGLIGTPVSWVRQRGAGRALNDLVRREEEQKKLDVVLEQIEKLPPKERVEARKKFIDSLSGSFDFL